jgi:hydroxyethylthiazole kinase-like sugar kinase family protein
MSRDDLTGTIRRRGERYNGYPVLPEYFGSYCMDGLAMALYAVYHSASFDEAIERCVNFLGDADSTAAVAGQIAGAIYGIASIDPRMIENLQRWDDHEIALRGVLLYDLGERGDFAPRVTRGDAARFESSTKTGG